MAERRVCVRIVPFLAIFLGVSGPPLFADPVGDVFNAQVSMIEREVLALAEAMPADKYDFAPSNGSFNGVRTYALQVRHIATEMYHIAASVSGEKAPVDLGSSDNGPDSLKTKEQILAYLKGAIAFAHKAMLSLNEKNQLDQVPSAFGRGTQSRLEAAAFLGLHTYDHYGQMVVYARMNGVIPGANIPRPGAQGKGKAK
jgi:hypothetical protein